MNSKKLLTFILPVLFFASCSDDNPVESDYNTLEEIKKVLCMENGSIIFAQTNNGDYYQFCETMEQAYDFCEKVIGGSFSGDKFTYNIPNDGGTIVFTKLDPSYGAYYYGEADLKGESPFSFTVCNPDYLFSSNDFDDIVTVIWPDIFDEWYDINQGRPLIPHDEDGTIHDLTYYVPAGQFKIFFQFNYIDLIPNVGEKDIPVVFDGNGYFRDSAKMDLGNYTTYWVIPDWNGGNVHFSVNVETFEIEMKLISRD